MDPFRVPRRRYARIRKVEAGSRRLHARGHRRHRRSADGLKSPRTRCGPISRVQPADTPRWLSPATRPRFRHRRREASTRETIALQQAFADRLVARVQSPCAARRRIVQPGADAAVELAVGHDRQCNIGDQIEPRLRRQPRGDIGQRLVEKKIDRGLLKRFRDRGVVRIGPGTAEPVSRLRPQRDGQGNRRASPHS